MKKKQILASLLAAVIVLSLLAVPVLAVGDGNIDSSDGGDSGGGSGSGMGTGSKQNYWNNESGVRITILKNGVKAYSMDWSNQPEAGSVRRSFASKSKLDYLHGASLSMVVNQYTSTVVAAKMPTIVGGSGGNNIEAIKRYFTDQKIVGYVSNGTGVPYDELTGGDYKLLLEPVAYFTFRGTKWAMTATEAGKYDVLISGQLRAWMKSLTHKNLPLSMFLEKSDTELGLQQWTGSRTGYQNNANIITYLGMGIVTFKAAPVPVSNTYDYEFRTDTDVIVSFPVTSSCEITPDDCAYVTLNVGGVHYSRQFICPAGGTQLIWIRWHTPSEPQQMTMTATGAGNPVTLNVNIVKLEEKTPPDPTYYDRSDDFTPSAVPDYGNNRTTAWGEWYARWMKTNNPLPGDGYWKFYYVTYSASLNIHSFSLTADNRCQTDYKVGGDTTMKSGYGIQVQVQPRVKAGPGVAASYDITSVQNMVATFPEFHYETYNRLLEPIRAGVWAFKRNLGSYYGNRIHYTPLWFPDGDYTVPVYVFDAWTPGGQLYATLSKSINIYDACLNDWYIHRVQS